MEHRWDGWKDELRPVQFRMGWNTIHATAHILDPLRYHVLKLDLHRPAWQRFVQRRLFPLLPAACQRFVQRWWPSCALPDCVVLKMPRRPDPDYVHCLEEEMTNYRRLAAFQGRLIPYFYGEAQCEGNRAAVVSFVPGVTAERQPKPLLATDELMQRIRVTVEELATTGIVYADVKLSNVILADDGRAVMIDLEQAYDEPDVPLAIEFLLQEFERQYKMLLKKVESGEHK